MPDEHLPHNTEDTVTPTGPTCYRDSLRECNAACVAFIAARPAGVAHTGAWVHCVDLKSRHDTSTAMQQILVELRRRI